MTLFKIESLDEYEYYASDFYYTPTRIAGPGAPEELNQTLVGCNCNSCVNEICHCQRNSSNFYFDSGKVKLCETANSSNKVIMECHDECVCAKLDLSVSFNTLTDLLENTLLCCKNRCIQYGPHKGLDIFETEKKGLGLRTNTLITKNSYICEYAGEVISYDEAMKRLKKNKEHNLMNYVFTLYEHSQDNVNATCVDPAVFGNIGRFINHSCSPNAFVMPIRVSSPVPHLCIFALKDILVNEEIVFDYGGGSRSNLHDSQKSTTVCFCGSFKCQKVLPGLV